MASARLEVVNMPSLCRVKLPVSTLLVRSQYRAPLFVQFRGYIAQQILCPIRARWDTATVLLAVAAVVTSM